MITALGKIASAAAVALLLLAALAGSASAAEEYDKYALEEVSAELSSNQAGAHADMTLYFKLTGTGTEPFANTRDVEFKLPPGGIANPQGVPRCTVDELGNGAQDSACPVDSQVGITVVRVLKPFPGTFTEPIYNMVPPKNSDIVARIGFIAVGYPTFVNVRVDPTDYSVISTIEGAPSASGLMEATTTLWGVPASPIHDEERLTPSEAISGEIPDGGRPANVAEKPFWSNPTDCSLQRQLTITARSYQLPSQPSTMSAPFPQISGCEKLSFDPRFTLVPTNTEAAAPTGVEAELVIPQDETPQGRATSTVKSARVTLPEGMSINPAAGDGLKACSADQVGYEKDEASHCPDEAKIGSVEVDVPALENPLHGFVYQRTPEPGNLFRFWMVSDEQGVHLKLPVEVKLNEDTGQISTVVNGIDKLGGLPQVPFSNLKLRIQGGPRAPLATPSACGTYQTHYSFTPWSGKPAAEGNTPMQITQGCGKGGFAPKLQAGTTNPRGGAFASFIMTLTRQDGEANPERLSMQMPQGLLAKIAGVPLCPEPAAASGNCPEGSRIGSVAAASGVGGAPLWIPQPGKDPTAIYLSGPYRGAPYSAVIRVPAQAGPFDLGTVVTRAQINVDPVSSTASITTDPLPQNLEGVPIAYRAVSALVDRPEFFLNPTNCSPKRIEATVTATNGQVANPSDGFQVTNCGQLPYSPKLELTLKGQTKRSGHPAVRAVLTQKPNQANNAKISVQLPTSQFIDQDHINNPCTRVQFNADNCPPLSILGTARAITPLLDQPLEGPVYFRSNGGERELPDIVADVRGGGLRIIQVGFVDSVPVKGTELARLRTRFLSLPDAPVSKIALSLYGGKKRGLLENSRDLCKTKRLAKFSFTGQNGKVVEKDQKIRTSCGKKKGS